jgi:ATP-binding cassette subfamily F protein 3
MREGRGTERRRGIFLPSIFLPSIFLPSIFLTPPYQPPLHARPLVDEDGPMLLLTATDLTRQFGNEPVFAGLTFAVHAGERIGLVGTNGAGKTTLLRLLAGLDAPEIGSVQMHGEAIVQLLDQEPTFEHGRTLWDEACTSLAPLQRLHDEMLAAAERITHATDAEQRRAAERRYAHHEERLRQLGAYHLDHRAERVLQGVGLHESQFATACSQLSGGEQRRLILAKLLLASPDVLLMDEPSNHLDIDGIRWLEEWLTTLPQGMIIVSHDRYFLDRVATKIFELDRGRITDYPGNFSAYEQQKAERIVVQQRTFEQQQAYVEDQEEFIRRYHYGQRAKQAKDREKKLARIQNDLVERPSELTGPAMGFADASRSGDVVVTAQDLGKAFDRPLFSDLTVRIERGERVGIIGPNGCGKSTLLKVLLGLEPPTAGSARLGHGVVVGYYDQKLENLPLDQTAIRAAWPPADPNATEGAVRNLLARFGIRGDRAFQRVGSMSGGEKSRIALVRLVQSRPNLLVMDEPTNHLDVWACQALERSLQEFEGTVITVSHDRYFLNRIAERLIVLGNGSPMIVEGNYDRYLEKREEQDQRAAAATAAAESKPSDRPAKSRTGRKRKFPYRKSADIEREIAEHERQLAALESRLADTNLYRDGEQVRNVRNQYDATKVRLGELYEHWEEAIELNG